MKWSLVLPIVAASATNALSDIIIKSRQAVARRGLTDTCASVDDNLPSSYGNIHVTACICISSLSDFIQSTSAFNDAVEQFGESQLANSLTELINNCHGRQTCHYPSHSKPVCNPYNPCDFTCTDGFEPSPPNNPTQCVCKPPYKECNGKCGSYPYGCPSVVPRNVKRNTPVCPSGLEVCGVTGGGNGKGWECVDTQSDLESCGGCLVPHPFGGSSNFKGTDCSQIDNASAVACRSGACKVSECVHGYIPSSSANACVPLTLVEPGGSSQPLVAQL